jgi:hypothetical protein
MLEVFLERIFRREEIPTKRYPLRGEHRSGVSRKA